MAKASKKRGSKRSKADAMLAGPQASDKPQLHLLTEELSAPELAGIRTLWGEAVAPGLTPHKLATVLRSAEAGDARDYLTLAEDMEERELHYSAVLSTRKRAIGGVDPVIEACGEDARSVEIADAVEQLVALPVFGSLIDHLTDAIGKGYAVSEIRWETSAKQWQPYDYRARDPRFFTFDQITRQELRLITAEQPMFGEPLPAAKYIRHVPRLKSGITIRGGLAKPAAWAFCFKSFSLKDWVAFAEVYGMPIRVGKYAPGATPDDKGKLLRAVRNIGSDAAAIIPETMAIDFIETGKGTGGSVVFEKLCDYLDKQISKLVLGQTMTTDHGSSMAQAKVHENVRHDILAADTKQLEETINRDLIRPFVDLNYGPQQSYPKFKLPVPKSEDLKALAENLRTIVPLGVRVREQEVRERFGFAEPDDGDAILSPAGLSVFDRDQHIEAPAEQVDAGEEQDPIEQDDTAVEPDDEAAAPKKKAARKGQSKKASNRRRAPAKKARNRAHAHDEDELDRVRDMALDGWQRQLDPMLKPIHDLVTRCSTYQQFVEGLPKALAHMDAAEFVKTLAASMAIARGLGDLGTTAHKGA